MLLSKISSIDRQIISSTEIDPILDRLDSSYYNKKSKKFNLHLLNLGIELKKIRDLTEFNELYLPNRYTRRYLDCNTCGVSLLGTSSMLRSRLPTRTKIAISEEEKSELLIKRGDILISRSGTIGTSVLCGDSYTNHVASDDCFRLRVNNKISGYLSAYLKSPIGLDLLQKDGHGKVIRHLKEENILNFILPIINISKLLHINKLMIESTNLVDKARELFNLAENIIFSSIYGEKCISNNVSENENGTKYFLMGSLQLISQRLDPHFYEKKAIELKKWAISKDHTFLGSIADVWEVGRFARNTVQAGNGIPLYSSADVMRSIVIPSSHLSIEKNRKNIQTCTVDKNMILISRSGKFGGILGRCTKAGDRLDGKVVTEHLIRVNITDENFDNDYVTALLSSDFFGYPLITATRFGKDVPEIDSNELKLIPIPKINENDIKSISKYTQEAYFNLNLANEKETEAQKELLTALNLEDEYITS